MSTTVDGDDRTEGGQVAVPQAHADVSGHGARQLVGVVGVTRMVTPYSMGTLPRTLSEGTPSATSRSTSGAVEQLLAAPLGWTRPSRGAGRSRHPIQVGEGGGVGVALSPSGRGRWREAREGAQCGSGAGAARQRCEDAPAACD